MRTLRSADLFCGGGGATCGSEMSGCVKTVFAVNHWSVAIETHRANFPHVKHVQCDLDRIHPSECERIDKLWASPPCPGHSLARGESSDE